MFIRGPHVGWPPRTMRGPALVATLVLAAAEIQAAPDANFDALWEEYRALAPTQDALQKRRRRAIARALGDVRTEASVDALLAILDNDQDIRTRVEALRSLGKVAPQREFRKAVVIAAGEPKTVLPLYVGEALARSKDAEVVRWVVAKLLVHSDHRIRRGAVEALGLLGAPEAREPLLKLYETLRDARLRPDLQYEVVRALGRIGGEGVRGPLLGAAASERPHQRLAAAETLLLRHRDAEALAAFRRLLRDGDRLVPVFAAHSAGAARETALVPDLAALLASPRQRLRVAARAALIAIAKRDLGASAEEWIGWHKRQALGEKEPEGRRTAAADGAVPLVGADRVLFMLDTSLSMTWPTWGPRLDVGKREMAKLVRCLPEATQFNAMTVAGYNKPWEKRLQEATPANLARAVEWVEERNYTLCTNTIDGLMAALEHDPPLDAAWWFSDGSLPVGGNYKEHEEILALVREANQLRKVEIHTVSLLWGKGIERYWKYEDHDDFEEFMRLLAEQSGGTFRDVRGPNG